VLSFGVHTDFEDTGLGTFVGLRLDDHCACAVAKDDADIPTSGADVEARGMDLTADYKHAFEFPADDKSIGNIQCIKKSAALRAQVEAWDLAHVELFVDEERTTGEVVL
jgi:hypothetical protein